MALNGDYKWEEFNEYTVFQSPENSPTTPAKFIDLGKVTINMARVASVKEYFDQASGLIISGRLIVNYGGIENDFVRISLAEFISKLPSITPTNS